MRKVKSYFASSFLGRRVGFPSSGSVSLPKEPAMLGILPGAGNRRKAISLMKSRFDWNAGLALHNPSYVYL